MRYPIGIQTFENIIEGNYLYIDKTELVHNLANSFTYVFLSRPRRFGKSLLVSTLQSYFEGKKELFKGLAAENLEKNWVQHPVLRFDFSTAKMFDANTLNYEINYKFSQYEEIYGKNPEAKTHSARLDNLIKQAYQKTGQRVVILIDEYDAPLLNVLDNPERLDAHRQIMRDFYSTLKYCDPYLRFVFITGITKFSQLSLFSELNNLKNISMLAEYAAICGITEEEMLTKMTEGIENFAKNQEISYEEAVNMLKDNYDGYHFTHPSPDIYNPFSLINAFSDRKIDNYWFASGGTSLAIAALQKNNITPEQLIKSFDASVDQFDKPFDRTDDVIPLLYQSGYLTIKSYDKLLQQYALKIPNKEVEISLFKTLLPYYLQQKVTDKSIVIEIAKGLLHNDIELVLNSIKRAFASVPQCDNTNYEGHYQSMLCLIFVLVGQFVEAEVRTANGRVDVVINNQQKIYLFEIKLNKNAEIALEQIEKKDYAQKFLQLGLPIVKVGLNFNSETRNVENWEVKELA